MPRITLSTICLCFSLLIGTGISIAASELDPVLRDWITQNIGLDRAPDGRDVLLIRKNGIRAYINVDDPKLADEARITLTNLAAAFDLDVKFTSIGINMVVATADSITEPDLKASTPLLKSFGLSDTDAAYIAADTDWSTGCGLYGSREPQERFLTFSVSLAPSRWAESG
jgi:hypothetical protein